MKIVLVQNRFGQTALGGASHVVEIIATSLVELGHKVVVISLAKKFFRQTKAGYEVIYLPSLFVSLNLWPKFLRIFYHLSLFWPGRGQKLAKLLAELKPDLVWGHNLMGFGWAATKYFSAYKWLQTLHDVQLFHPSGQLPVDFVKNSWLQNIYQYFLRDYFKKPFLVISPSRWLLWLHQEAGFFKGSHVLPLGNPVNFVNKMENVQKKLYWFWAGQMYAGKGLKWLVSLWQKDKTLPLLYLAGSGHLDKWLQHEVKKDSRLKYLGKLTSSEIYSHLSEARGLVFTSQILENSPTIIAEALACSCPVVAPRAGGIPEMIQDGINGFLYEPDSPKDFKRALIAGGKLEIFSNKTNQLSSTEYLKKVFENLT